jgi:hypothetical protein
VLAAPGVQVMRATHKASRAFLTELTDALSPPPPSPPSPPLPPPPPFVYRREMALARARGDPLAGDGLRREERTDLNARFWDRVDRVERIRRSRLSPPPRERHMGRTVVRGVGDWDPLMMHLGSQFSEHLPLTFSPTAYMSVRGCPCHRPSLAVTWHTGRVEGRRPLEKFVC